MCRPTLPRRGAPADCIGVSMILRLTTADENDAQILTCHTGQSFAGQTDLRGMAVSAMTQVRLDPTIHGRDARATKAYFHESLADK
jgi:hypothetical protein